MKEGRENKVDMNEGMKEKIARRAESEGRRK